MTEKILVVDDSKLVTDIVKMRLEMYGYDVRLAHSGEEALVNIQHRSVNDGLGNTNHGALIKISGFKASE